MRFLFILISSLLLLLNGLAVSSTRSCTIIPHSTNFSRFKRHMNIGSTIIDPEFFGPGSFGGGFCIKENNIRVNT